MSAEKKITIRKFAPADRAIVRHLCCETGFLGNPIDPVFEDRELFADYLTAYYTDWESESSFVLEVDGVVKGYLLGSFRPARQQLHNIYQNVSIFLRGMVRYRKYNDASRRFVHWIFRNAWREVPAAPRRAAHFHINLLAEARSVPTTRKLMDAYLQFLHEQGVKRVYGQMVTFESRRGAKLFERYGFRVLNRSEISKYKAMHPQPVYLCTVIKDLDHGAQLYAQSR